MATISVKAQGRVAAPADRVYKILADYHQHHPHILPPAFSDLKVEEGGVGAGTVFSIRMKAGGRSRAARMYVAEPQPGRVLTESEPQTSLLTTFTVVPDGDTSRVQIATTWQSTKGIGGLFERLFAPRLLQRIYVQELENLDRYARHQRSL
ncbi:MAG: SRPBCC family protein [Dehalococcoidia bacterium]